MMNGQFTWEMIGPGRDALIGLRLPAGQGMTGWVAQYGGSMVCGDILADTRHHDAGSEPDAHTLRSMLSVPLQVSRRQAIDSFLSTSIQPNQRSSSL